MEGSKLLSSHITEQTLMTSCEPACALRADMLPIYHIGPDRSLALGIHESGLVSGWTIPNGVGAG
jgi:hypothetical protein